MASPAVHQVEKDALVSGIKEINNCLQTLLADARKAVEVSTEHFIDKDIAKLFGLATVYKNVLQNLKLQKKVDLDHAVEHHYSRYQDVREVCDDWKELELQWDALLKDVDKKLDRSGPEPLTKGQEEFTTLGARIVIVSFGLYEGAVRWLKDTKCPFQMLIDSKRKMYQEFGLKRSAFMVWSVECMAYYGEQMRAGKKLPSPYENVHDDVNQMGGDFIVSDEGKLVFFYPSQASTDRPAVDSLLQALKAQSSRCTSPLLQADST